MNWPENDAKLKSSFVVSGRLKIPVEELVNKILNIPTLKRIKGEPLTFQLVEFNRNNNSALKIVGNKLIFEYYFKRKSQKEDSRSMIKFISILALLSQFYEPELSSIYPNIMEILASCSEEITLGHSKIENSELLLKKQKSLSDVNCSLSLKILDFQAQNAKLKAEKEILGKFSREAIYNAIERTGTNDPNSADLPKVMGTTAESYKAVKSMVFENGLK